MATRAPLTETAETDLRPGLLSAGNDAELSCCDGFGCEACRDESPYVCNDCDGFGCSFCRDGGEDL